MKLTDKNCTPMTPNKDPMGRAVEDFLKHGRAKRLRVMSSLFDEDEMPVEHLFRELKDMNHMEQRALDMACGKVLDVGAGTGCHTLELQRRGLDTTAIDRSPGCVEVMRKRGVKDAREADFFGEECTGTFHTILMLMNGSGIIGCLERMPAFFERAKELLTPGGQILMDSSDLRYVYENEEGALDWDPEWGYYGQVDYQMKYDNITGETFDWLYVDPETLAKCAQQAGFDMQIVCCGDNMAYLAQLTPKNHTSTF